MSSIVVAWLLKVAVEILFTPVTYIIINKVKKFEGEDYYDKDTDFNTLSLRV